MLKSIKDNVLLVTVDINGVGGLGSLARPTATTIQHWCIYMYIIRVS